MAPRWFESVQVCHLRLNIFCVLCKHLSKCETWARHWAEAAPCFQFSWFYENWDRALGLVPGSWSRLSLQFPLALESPEPEPELAPSVGPQSTGSPPRLLRVRYNLDTWLKSRLQQELVIDSCYNNTRKRTSLKENRESF